MPEWSWEIWALIIAGGGFVTVLGYDIERALNELRAIRTALEDIRDGLSPE
jgi:hypothetical protein